MVIDAEATREQAGVDVAEMLRRARKMAGRCRGEGEDNPGLRDFFKGFRGRVPMPQGDQPMRGLGSGFIVSESAVKPRMSLNSTLQSRFSPPSRSCSGCSSISVITLSPT